MELKEFIKEALLQISEGVKEAQEACMPYGAIISPAEITDFKSSGNYMKTKIEDRNFVVQNIEFEVGLTENAGKQAKSGFGVFLGSVNVGTSNSLDNKTLSMTNLKFSVPIVLPSIDNENSPVIVLPGAFPPT